MPARASARPGSTMTSPRLNGSALSIRGSAQEHVLGQVEDGPVALLVQLERLVAMA